MQKRWFMEILQDLPTHSSLSKFIWKIVFCFHLPDLEAYPSLKQQNPVENRPFQRPQKGKWIIWTNHQFSGVNLLLVSGSRWWFQIFCLFSPRSDRINDPNLTCAYFSDGLVNQPPTTWRITPLTKWLVSNPHLKAMSCSAIWKGNVAPGLGDIYESWLLTTYPSPGMILQVGVPPGSLT